MSRSCTLRWRDATRNATLVFLTVSLVSTISPYLVWPTSWGQAATGDGLRSFMEQQSKQFIAEGHARKSDTVEAIMSSAHGYGAVVLTKAGCDRRNPRFCQPTSAATLGSSVSSLSFTGVVGGASPAAKTFTISNTGGGTLTWSLTETASWLSVSPTSGTTTTAPAQVTVSLTSTGLLEGTYSAPITITAPGSTNGSQQISVTLTLTSPPATIGLSPANLSWTFVEGTTNSGSQSFNIANTGAGTLTWSVAEGACG